VSVIELPKGSEVGAVSFGERRKTKMIPDMGAVGQNCPIIWRANAKNPNGTREIIILVSRDPAMTIRGEVSDEAYDALPVTIVEW
jgi:hypothetical protein